MGRQRELQKAARRHVLGVSDLVSLHLEVKVKCQDSQDNDKARR